MDATENCSVMNVFITSSSLCHSCVCDMNIMLVITPSIASLFPVHCLSERRSPLASVCVKQEEHTDTFLATTSVDIEFDAPTAEWLNCACVCVYVCVRESGTASVRLWLPTTDRLLSIIVFARI